LQNWRERENREIERDLQRSFLVSLYESLVETINQEFQETAQIPSTRNKENHTKAYYSQIAEN
jgi:hypothetical protein